MAYKVLFVNNLLVIVAFWVFVPLFAFGFTYFVSKLFSYFKIEIKSSKSKNPWHCFVSCRIFEAFSAGMNNVANAVGPLVAAGVLDVAKGTLYGEFCLLGALLLGRRVLETNGKKITRFSKGKAFSYPVQEPDW